VLNRLAADIAAATSTDDLVDMGLRYDLTVPLMSAVAASPEVLATISQIDAALTTDVIRALLVKVTQDGGSYDLVVAEYIASQSLSAAG
jgi:hypothetical protein